MNKTCLVLGLLVAISLHAPSGFASEADSRKKAETAARSWLTLVDSGKYDESWKEASGLFRHAVTSAGWAGAIKSARSPLGALKSRKPKASQFTRNLPGAPEGEYVVIQFDADFEGGGPRVETITPMLDPDGTWRVSGYFVK